MLVKLSTFKQSQLGRDRVKDKMADLCIRVMCVL